MSSEQNKVILRAEHISKTYGEKKVLEDISIHLEQGELVSLLGVSGSGKTTLFNVLSGIIPPDEGKVYLKDQDVTSTPGSRYVASRRLESIRLTGFIPHEEQGAVRAACGLAVAPSLWEETFGMVVLESWLHGTPVIVTPRGGLPELISHGRNGWIAREPSADALAETLSTALEEEERWPSMGAHGQQLLSSTYSPAAWLQSMGSLLEELRLFRQSPNIAAS